MLPLDGVTVVSMEQAVAAPLDHGRQPRRQDPRAQAASDIDGIEPRVDAVPALGAHTDAILTSLGCSSDSIDRLRSAGTL